jgi:two-component system response regulator CpxR
MKPKRTILCVDDNEQALSVRKVMLQTRGYRVAAFAAGEEAWAHFQKGGVDLVIASLSTCGTDGSALVERIKNLSPETPAILLAAKGRSFDSNMRADVFLAKGMDAPADLLERIRLLLIRKRGPRRATVLPAVASQRIGAA